MTKQQVTDGLSGGRCQRRAKVLTTSSCLSMHPNPAAMPLPVACDASLTCAAPETISCRGAFLAFIFSIFDGGVGVFDYQTYVWVVG